MTAFIDAINRNKHNRSMQRSGRSFERRDALQKTTVDNYQNEGIKSLTEAERRVVRNRIRSKYRKDRMRFYFVAIPFTVVVLCGLYYILFFY